MTKTEFLQRSFAEALALAEHAECRESQTRGGRTGSWYTLDAETTLCIEWDRLLGAISVQLCGTDAVLVPEGLYDPSGGTL